MTTLCGATMVIPKLRLKEVLQQLHTLRVIEEHNEERDRLSIGQTFPKTSETLFVSLQLLLNTSHLSLPSLCSQMNGPLACSRVLPVIFHVAGKIFSVLVDRYRLFSRNASPVVTRDAICNWMATQDRSWQRTVQIHIGRTRKGCLFFFLF